MDRVVVVGVGLIGGSLAGALRGPGRTVVGFDRDPDVLRLAVERELIDRQACSLEVALAEADLVILATPPRTVLELLPLVDELTPPRAVVTDCASVKLPLVQLMSSLPGAQRMVGGHPMAGKEHSGVSNSDVTIFRDRPFALCPTQATEPAVLDHALDMVRSIGSRPVVLDAASHDSIVARTSHVPQVVSMALALTLSDGDGCLAGPGIRGMLRLAAGDPSLWKDILQLNGHQVAVELRSFATQLGSIADIVEGEAGPELGSLLCRGRAVASSLEGRT